MNEDNKRIARNTIYLYIRQILILAISLYTSRVVLNSLGATDYGLYNVVGGIIVLFSFISNALSNSASRYIAYAIGSNNPQEINRTFGSFLSLYYCVAAGILILGETVGLWFVYNYLTIPPERFTASLWVYHFSIASVVMNLLYVPYNCLIVAHERMSAFAYISILEAILKLCIALLLSVAPFDKLVFYAALILALGVLIRFIYIYYCKRNFTESSSRCVWDKNLFVEILKYSGWVLFGSLAFTTYTQGLNVLLNIFFGPVVNAARGIAVQIQSATQNFIVGFQTAIYPQIIKSYAQNNLARMYVLLHTVCKGSFFLFYIIALPFLLKTSTILELWLKNVPDYTVPFTCCILVFSLLRALTNEINHAVQATGKIKVYQFVDGLMGLSILPISYIALKFFNANPVIVFIILVVVELLTVIARIYIGIPQIGDSVNKFSRDVLLPVLSVTLIGAIIPVLISHFVSDTLWGFLYVTLSVVLWSVPVVYFLGLNRNEKALVTEKVKEYKKKIQRGKVG